MAPRLEPLNTSFTTLKKMKPSSHANELAPRWYAESINSKLPHDCRAKCDLCFGYGSHAGIALYTCQGCQTGYEPCPLHTCLQCGGTGLVCPQCRGMRFVRAHEWDAHRSTSVEVIRCPKCCEGNNVNVELELRVIERYMARWRADHDRFKLRIATNSSASATREGEAQ